MGAIGSTVGNILGGVLGGGGGGGGGGGYPQQAVSSATSGANGLLGSLGLGSLLGGKGGNPLGQIGGLLGGMTGFNPFSMMGGFNPMNPFASMGGFPFNPFQQQSPPDWYSKPPSWWNQGPQQQRAAPQLQSTANLQRPAPAGPPPNSNVHVGTVMGDDAGAMYYNGAPQSGGAGAGASSSAMAPSLPGRINPTMRPSTQSPFTNTLTSGVGSFSGLPGGTSNMAGTGATPGGVLGYAQQVAANRAGSTPYTAPTFTRSPLTGSLSGYSGFGR